MIEWVGVLVLVALVVAAVVALGLPQKVSSVFSANVPKILDATGTTTGQQSTATPVPASTQPAPASTVAASNIVAPVPSGTPTTRATLDAAVGPTPNPQPGPPPPGDWSWPASLGRHADQLPTGGARPYSPGKQGRGNPVWDKAKKGWKDQDGNIWQWPPPAQQHGGPHWDVQHPDGSHTNVAPDGTVIGKDNFPNKRRQPTPPPQTNPDPAGGQQPAGGGDGNTAKIVGGAAAGAGLGVTLWWLGKLASPACGPLVVVCAIGF